nr:MAG: hypothetical protein DIU68_14155 [Chloroflexota bacterium]
MEGRALLRIPERFRPITGAELAFQTRAGRARRKWLVWLGKLVYLAALGVCLIAYLGEFIGSLTWRDTTRIHETVESVMPFALIVTAVMYLLLVLEALARGANTIVREKETNNWEMLVLTGVDARRIVRGKWWAALRVSWPAWLRLLPLRAGLSVFIGAELSRVTSAYMATFAPGQTVIPPHPVSILLVPVLLLVFSFAALALASALGVLASSAAKRPVVALSAALALHIGLIVAVVLSTQFLQYLLYAGNAFITPARIVASGVLSTLQVSWVDNATLFAATLTTYHLVPHEMVAELSRDIFVALNEPRRLQLLSYAISLPLLLGMYAGLTWIALRLAERFAIRAGALARQVR